MVISIIVLIKQQSHDEENVDLEVKEVNSIPLSILMLVLGGVLLYFGSEWFVLSAIDIANYFGVSERIIGITVVSVGTSIPELATSLVALLNKEKNISIGNLIGSNIFNVFAVLGITSILTPLNVVNLNIVNFDIYVMLLFAFIILPLMFFPKKLVLGRFEGLIIFSLYVVYILNIVI